MLGDPFGAYCGLQLALAQSYAFRQGNYGQGQSLGQLQQAGLAHYKQKSRSEKIMDMEYDLQRYLNGHETITFNRVY
jgi:hypothetical protein